MSAEAAVLPTSRVMEIRMTQPVYGAVINCIDGRVQRVVTDYLRKRWNVEYVDVITEVAPERVLAERTDSQIVARLRSQVLSSLKQQQSPRLAVAAHSDCESNRVPEDVQRQHLEAAVTWLAAEFTQAEIIGVWIDPGGKVHEQPKHPLDRSGTANP